MITACDSVTDVQKFLDAFNDVHPMNKFIASLDVGLHRMDNHTMDRAVIRNSGVAVYTSLMFCPAWLQKKPSELPGEKYPQLRDH